MLVHFQEKRSRRRSIRGRRSSIKIVTDGSSPAFIAAPLSESVITNEKINPIIQLEKKRDSIIAYKAVLNDEIQVWKNKTDRRKRNRAKAKRTGHIER
ncbi:hypothetical protein OESDEN_17081 [Oesophagostomum dentatum]|uniref:Uncharacterized protein n=1 Tax=Oesophagostomum dentatum TaxID=61180 RepID=A0A0B1SI84_OESDE|nr:hypothetical protein OESDEN_17081 [Oesophagostomum dentatum]